MTLTQTAVENSDTLAAAETEITSCRERSVFEPVAGSWTSQRQRPPRLPQL